MDSPLLTYKEAAAYLQRSVRFLERLVQDQAITHVRLGRSVRFTQADLDDYIMEQRVLALPY